MLNSFGDFLPTVSAVTPPKEEDKAFAIFNLIDKVNRLLYGNGGEYYSRLCRVSLKKMLREDAVREFVMSYKFSYTDSTAIPTYHKLPKNLE